MTDPVTRAGDGIRLTVHVQPKARRTEIVGRHGDALKVRLSAPPVDGAANKALVEFLAETLKIPQVGIRIAGGGSSRRKAIMISGVTVARARRALGLA
ncbi:MAG: YggU family protein [Gemmatimonadales bacterium]|nr:MAG: YggU family protein [Gemmatimonadales bacterium]